MYVMISAGARSGPGWNRDLMVKMNCVIRGWVPNSKVETRTQGVKEEDRNFQTTMEIIQVILLNSMHLKRN